MKGGQQLLVTMNLVFLVVIGVASCSKTTHRNSDASSARRQVLSNDTGANAGAGVSRSPSWAALGSDVASIVTITDILPPRYSTVDGLQGGGSPHSSSHRVFQIALASVQHRFLPNQSALLAFQVNTSLNFLNDASVLDRAVEVETGDTGLVFGLLDSGDKRWGTGFYGLTTPNPWDADDYELVFRRDTVIQLRQSGEDYESLALTDWYEYSDGVAFNLKSGWSASISEAEARVVKSVELLNRPTPSPWSPTP